MSGTWHQRRKGQNWRFRLFRLDRASGGGGLPWECQTEGRQTLLYTAGLDQVP